jgi:hypothetical protein
MTTEDRAMSNEAGEHGEAKQPQAGVAVAPRRPYVAPRLTRLGAVRDLTFGSLGSRGEDAVHKNSRLPPHH